MKNHVKILVALVVLIIVVASVGYIVHVRNEYERQQLHVVNTVIDEDLLNSADFYMKDEVSGTEMVGTLFLYGRGGYEVVVAIDFDIAPGDSAGIQIALPQEFRLKSIVTNYHEDVHENPGSDVVIVEDGSSSGIEISCTDGEMTDVGGKGAALIKLVPSEQLGDAGGFDFEFAAGHHSETVRIAVPEV